MIIKNVKYLGIFLAFCAAGCASRQTSLEPELSSISIVDRNGFSETVSADDRLKKYENVDFLQNQPYQKVMRVYERDLEGNIAAYITSYHPNGQPKQYLEVLNARAFGKYQEWYQNGIMKVDSNVIGGTADLNSCAEQSWLFEGCNRAWDEEGNLQAEIYYVKGEMQGIAIHYHPNKQVWKRIPYDKNLVNGAVEIYLESGELLQTTEYVKGIKEGSSLRFWALQKLASKEQYQQGLLMSGEYYNSCGDLLSTIVEGAGYRVLFSKDGIAEMHEYCQGKQAGEIRVFGQGDQLVKVYHVKNEIKHGEEIVYFTGPCFVKEDAKPKLSLSWYEGKIQGIVKTWYDNGNPESQREMSNNVKNGLLTAWYRDGSLMLIEEYDHDKLVKGEYYSQGEKTPVSQVCDGKGVVTLFDAEGHFIRKIPYNQKNLEG